MIRLQDLTPEIYYKQSRDFQFIGRLYDIILNYIKTNTDMIYSIPSADAAGSKMIDLLALTLGFTAKHDYNVKQLTAICSILPLILKNKGNIQSILLIGQALLNSEGVTEAFGYNIDENNPYLIQIYIPPSLSDINLLKDLLTYVLPAGMTAEVVRASSQNQFATTGIVPTQNVQIYPTNVNELSQLWVPGSTLPATDRDTSGILTNSTMFVPGKYSYIDTVNNIVYVEKGTAISIAAAYGRDYGEGTVSWTSADNSVATVTDAGVITGVWPGTTTISGRNNITLTVNVIVPDNQENNNQGE